MSDGETIVRGQLARQIAHWELASRELADLERSAAPLAWASLERYVGVSLRKAILNSVSQLRNEVHVVRALFQAARTPDGFNRVSAELVRVRDRYLQTETMIDYFAHAVNTRTNPSLAANLRAFDVLAVRSMAQLLEPLGKTAPPVLTFFDKGLGASILKAGLRLWDGSVSPVATIKVTFHNRRRPTALIHETGHQVAHILGWNEDLARSLETGLRPHGPDLAAVWASWSSEIAADCFGFVHTGYAAVAALSDVVGGAPETVFRYGAGDPHPISYVRVLLGVEMCRRFFGRGPWDDLGLAWADRYPLAAAAPGVRDLLTRSRPALTQIVEICLMHRSRCFQNRALADVLNPARVGMESLAKLEADAGRSLYSSPKWVWSECVRLIALTGLRFATHPADSDRVVKQQDQFMDRLGQTAETLNVGLSA